MRSQAVRVFVPLSIVRSLGQSVTRELQGSLSLRLTLSLTLTLTLTLTLSLP